MRRRFAISLAFAAVLLGGCGDGTQPRSPAVAVWAPKVVVDPEFEQKNIVVLTERAAARIRQLIQEQDKRYFYVAISSENEYRLGLIDRADPKEDYLGVSQGVIIAVDRKTSELIPIGFTLDYLEHEKTPAFKFSFSDFDKTPLSRAMTLADARRVFKTRLIRQESDRGSVPEPPRESFDLVRYKSQPGRLAAFLTPDPKDGKKHPAIIWITGGDCNTINQSCWDEDEPQSASVYRKSGIVMMMPSLRGGNDNPGVKESFFGEVDDILAAAEFLRRQSYVDPDRVYLGGHSTGGTLVLLTAECSDRFRAVFSFGPTENVFGCGPSFLRFAASDRLEHQLRSPIRWLQSIRTPTFVFEGTGGNLSSLISMSRVSTNRNVHFIQVNGADHFDVLAPTNLLIASKILRDTGPMCRLEFTEEEVNKPFVK